MKRTLPILLGSIAVALVLGACGGSATSSSSPVTVPAGPSTTTGAAAPTAEVNPAGDIPDNQAYVVYKPPAGGYSLQVPEGWARVESGGAVTFTDKLNSIRVETAQATTAPTAQSAEQVELPAVRAAAQGFKPGKVSSTKRKAGTAVVLTYGADAAADPVTGRVVHDAVERYEFWRAGTEVVLTLSGPQGADNVDPWRIVTDSFAWT